MIEQRFVQVLLCQSALVEADQTCSADASVDAGSFDPQGGSISITQSPAGPYPLGDTLVTLTVTDNQGIFDSCTATVMVEDNSPPSPDNLFLPIVSGQCSATISAPPTATDNCAGAIIGTTFDPLNYTEQGTFSVRWTFDDGNGNVSSQDQTVIIEDTDTDGDQVVDCNDPDDDNDGVVDALDTAVLDPDLCEDVDQDGCDDCSVGTDGFGPLADNDPNNDGLDTDGDGVCDAGEGRMTGGGSVFGSIRVTHGFELHCSPTKNPGNLEINWGRGNQFHLTALTSIVCSDNPLIDEAPRRAGFDTLEGTGIGRMNRVPGALISFKFTDAGEPGRGADLVEFSITPPGGGAPIVVSGTLNSGNQQAHGK